MNSATHPKHLLFLICAAASLSAACGPDVQARPFAPDCSNPRAAAQTWLDNQLSGATADAIRCFDWDGAEVPSHDRERLSYRLVRVLDTRGDRVSYAGVPATAPEGGWPREVPLFANPSTNPEFFFVQEGERWVLSAESIRSIDRVYADLLPIDVQQYAPELLREEIGFGVAWWQVLGLLLCLFLGWLSRSLVAKWAIWIGVKFLRRRGDGTSEELLAKAAQPVGTLVMAIVVWRLIPLLLFPLGFNNVANIALQVLVALSGVMLVYRLVDVVSEILQRRADQTDTKLDDQLIPLLRKSAKVIVVVIGGIFVLQNLDVDVESLLAGVGVGGLAFSFAARDMIANLFGSVSIFADGPFQIGDWVAVGGDEGSVEEVGMRATRIRTANNTVLTIPNSKIADAVVENWSLRPKRRTRVILGVGYDSTPEQVEAFCRGIGGILDANARVEPESHVAMMSGFGDSALEITVFFHLKVESLTGEMQEKHNIFLEFMRLAAALGVEFAYPTQTLHVASTVSPLAAPSMTSRTPEALAAIADSFGPGGAESHPDGPTLPAAAGASSAESSE